MIKVVGSNIFAQYSRSIETNKGMILEEVLQLLEIPPNLRRSIFVVMDGKVIQPVDTVNDGSEVHLFLVPEGG